MRLRYIPFALLCLACMLPGSAGAVAGSEAPPWLLAYRLKAGETLRYKLTANIKGSIPLFDNPTPSELNVLITMVYHATPKTVLEDGTSDVAFTVEAVDAEVEKIPFPVPLEQAQQILNQTVTLDRTGEVKQVQGGEPLPFGVSVPGVDPKRLYALLFPIVFQTQPVNIGDEWAFKSGLLGGEGAEATFKATVLPPQAPAVAPRPVPGKKGRAPAVKAAVPPKPNPAVTRIGERFQMTVDQKVDVDKKPVTGDTEAHRFRQGRIEGNGVFDFDRAKGRFTRGVVNINANIEDNLVGKPQTPDEPKQLISKVKATVKVELQPMPAPPGVGKSEGKKE